MEKMVMISEWRYERMLDSCYKAMDELEKLRQQLLKVGEGSRDGKNQGIL